MLYIFNLLIIIISPVQKMEEERLAHEQKLAKMEAEMRSVFQAKVQEKEAKLKQSEEEVSLSIYIITCKFTLCNSCMLVIKR